ncbi:hypothetical protein [Actinoalloteichus hymeniacidonis]|nr:hypothetical protein [Actinoalloteichus hymeniacidonis]MBB5909327.1 hypothetical protein [Actinoalloteichus hymeniacidonis]
MTSWSHGGQGPDDSGSHGPGHPASGSFPAQGGNPGPGGYSGPYGGLGVYGAGGGEPPREPGKGRALLIGGLVTVLVVTIGATIVLAVNNSRSDSASEPTETTETTEESPPPSDEPESDEGTDDLPPPTVPGGKVVGTDRGGVYDVPESWVIEENTITYGDPAQEGITLESTATFENGSCAPGYLRAGAGVTIFMEPDLPTAATEVARRVADGAYNVEGTPPEVEVSEPESITLAADTPAQYAQATATVADPAACGSPSGSVHVVTIPTTDGNGALALVAVGDQEVDNAVGPDDLRMITESLRPANG